MGSKGSQSTNTVQNTAQTYNANPAIAGIGSQAIQQAQAAGSQPFQMPQAPVAGFSADQQGAFQQYRNLQGSAWPYLNQANQAYGNAASPISGENIGQFYDPMASRITSNLRDVFGHQNVGTQGNLIQAAGGVGADRIAVGMGESEKAQGAIANNAYLGAYQQALQAAQQQKQLQLGAGSGFTNLAAGATQDNLALTNAYLQSGQVQQHQTQQELNAPYQQRLAQIAYPYQQAQFLAGITGGLAPAFGGTTYGNQNGQTTPPQPSALSQVLGIGAAGAGLYGAFGGFGAGNDIYSPSNLANPGNSLNNISDSQAAQYENLYGNRGGATPFADGGEVGEEDAHIPGITSNEGLSPIPYIPLHGGAGHSGPLTGGINFPQPEQQKQQQNGGGFGDVLKTAASIVPFFLKDGGVAGYEEGGGDDSHFSPGQILRDAYEGNYGPKAWDAVKGYFSSPAAAAPANAPNFGDRFGTPPAATPTIADAGNNRQIGTDKLIQGMTQPYRLEAPGVRPTGNPKNMPGGVSPGEADEGVAPAPNREVGSKQVMRAMMPQASQPYPDALERGPGAVATRSPWMALVNAGAAMASTPGPLGVSLGKGMLAGTQSLDNQRKELQSEEQINQKAQALYQTAKAELDKYNKMTPYESGRLALQNKELNQPSVPGVIKPITELEIDRLVRRMESDYKYGTVPLDQKRALAVQWLEGQRAKQGIGAAAAPAAAASAGPPPGAKFSPSTNKWWTPDGQSYQFDKDGKAY